MFQLDAAALHAVLRQAEERVSRGSTEVTPEGKGYTIFKVSDREKSRMRQMCELPDSSGKDCFPK